MIDPVLAKRSAQPCSSNVHTGKRTHKPTSRAQCNAPGGERTGAEPGAEPSIGDQHNAHYFQTATKTKDLEFFDKDE